MIRRDTILLNAGAGHTYTLREVARIAYRHGQDGIAHYAPHLWAGVAHASHESARVATRAYVKAYNRGWRNYGHGYAGTSLMRAV